MHTMRIDVFVYLIQIEHLLTSFEQHVHIIPNCLADKVEQFYAHTLTHIYICVISNIHVLHSLSYFLQDCLYITTNINEVALTVQSYVRI